MELELQYGSTVELQIQHKVQWNYNYITGRNLWRKNFCGSAIKKIILKLRLGLTLTSYRISRKFGMELNLVVSGFL